MTAEPLEFPTRDESHQVEEDGLVEVQRAVVKQLTWIFRPQPIRDYGVDAHLEVVSDDDHVTGKNIGAQIKSGLSWFCKPAPGGWTSSENTLKRQMGASMAPPSTSRHGMARCSYTVVGSWLSQVGCWRAYQSQGNEPP